uniref:Uncharacterized protein n=1 Tax=Aegilops tauschii subsp. strangulata TaxID=200361 RepID=A0A453BED0_AEGTS
MLWPVWLSTSFLVYLSVAEFSWLREYMQKVMLCTGAKHGVSLCTA